MKSKVVLLLIVCLYIIQSAKSQSKISPILLNNDSIKFKILRTSAQLLDTNKMEVSKSLINLMASNQDRKMLSKIKRSEWLKLLSNQSSDWAANLCLYDLYKKDATIFENVKSKEKWRICCKKTDLAFWTKKLR